MAKREKGGPEPSAGPEEGHEDNSGDAIMKRVNERVQKGESWASAVKHEEDQLLKLYFPTDVAGEEPLASRVDRLEARLNKVARLLEMIASTDYDRVRDGVVEKLNAERKKDTYDLEAAKLHVDFDKWKAEMDEELTKWIWGQKQIQSREKSYRAEISELGNSLREAIRLLGERTRKEKEENKS